MRLSEQELSVGTLQRLGREAVAMLVAQRYEALAQRYRYAMAHGRDGATALEEDFRLGHNNGSEVPAVADLPGPATRVSYFEPNDSKRSFTSGLARARRCPGVLTARGLGSGGGNQP